MIGRAAVAVPPEWLFTDWSLVCRPPAPPAFAGNLQAL